MRKPKIKIDKSTNRRNKASASKRRISIDEFEITRLVTSLSGVIKLPKDYDYKIDYAEYLLIKYESLK